MKLFKKILSLLVSGLIIMSSGINSYAFAMPVDLKIKSEENYQLFKDAMENNFNKILEKFRSNSADGLNESLLCKTDKRFGLVTDFYVNLENSKDGLKLRDYALFKSSLNQAFRSMIKIIKFYEEMYDNLLFSHLTINEMFVKKLQQIDKRINTYTHCLSSLAIIIDYIESNEKVLKDL